VGFHDVAAHADPASVYLTPICRTSCPALSTRQRRFAEVATARSEVKAREDETIDDGPIIRDRVEDRRRAAIMTLGKEAASAGRAAAPAEAMAVGSRVIGKSHCRSLDF
jgi:hypothetical protein